MTITTDEARRVCPELAMAALTGDPIYLAMWRAGLVDFVMTGPDDPACCALGVLPSCTEDNPDHNRLWEWAEEYVGAEITERVLHGDRAVTAVQQAMLDCVALLAAAGE